MREFSPHSGDFSEGKILEEGQKIKEGSGFLAR